jgi:hypothetical protein
VNESAARLLDLVLAKREARLKSKAGVTPAFDLDAMQVVSTNGLIPECAMSVQRDFDGGEFSLFTPEASCACFFEAAQDPSLLTDPPAEWAEQCPICDTKGDCDGDAACRRGYCEAN